MDINNENKEIEKINLSDFDKCFLLYLNVDEILNFSKNNENKLSEGILICLNKYKEIQCDIFSGYNFLDDINEGILNNEKTKNCFFIKILNIIQDTQNNNLNSIIEKIKTEIKNDNLLTEEETFISLILLLYLYFQENVWGPSFTFIKETEKIDFEKELNKFNENYFNRLIKNNLLKEEEIAFELSSYGEEPYKYSQFIIFYYICYYFICNFKKDSNLKFDFNKFSIIKLWKIRILKILNQLIQEPIDSIQKEIDNLYNEFNIDNLNIDNETKGLLQIEKSFFYIRYFHNKKCTNMLETAKKNLNIDINLTGKMGKKTKYQEFDTPILVVDIKNENKNIKEKDNLTYENNMTLDSINKDNPLLENTKLSNPEEEKYFSNQIITINDQIYICALLNYLKTGLPDEELNREIILSYSEKSLKKSFDWLVYSKLLYHRSLAEDKSTKKIERSLLQIESLCNQFNDREPIPYNRLKYYFIIEYPLIFNLKKKYAESFMKFGAVKTAFEIFKNLHMFEEAIKCLYVSNNKEEAKKLSIEVLNKKKEPGIYCILGELENKIEYFNKALEITNNKYTRAYRCLGRYYYINKDLNKAKENYEKAMEINPIFPDIWFNLGIIYMNEKNYQKSLNCFSKNLSINDSNCDVWGNLGVCFIQLKKFKQAIKCFEEGYLRSNKNWKILDNLIYVSIESKDINKIIFCLEQFYYIDQYQQIKISYFYYLTKIYLENLKNYNERDKIYLKEKIYNLFFKFSEVDGLKPEIWDLYALFIQENEIINNNNEGKNDKIYEKIVDVRLKEIRTLMLKNIEWEKDDKIKNILCDIIKNIRLILSKIILDNDFVSDKKMFINGIEEKINNANKKNEIK